MKGELADPVGSHGVLTLATATREGVPHATPLLYIHLDEHLYVWLQPDSGTAARLRDNPRTAYSTTAGGAAGTAIQGDAEAVRVFDPQRCRDVMRRFGGHFESLDLPDSDDVAVWRLTPSRTRTVALQGTTGTHDELALRLDLLAGAFRALPREDVAGMAATMPLQTYAAGDEIITQGMPAHSFYVILDGEVEVVRTDHDGHVEPLATLRTGQYFGEAGVLRQQPRAASVRATTTTRCMVVDRALFLALVTQSVGTAERLGEVADARVPDAQ